ncbi:brain and acute leukemia cytoplasmic protein isoform X2 [Artibeus jamaicensis]|uniref:brain and acute leukemia cytoplasmic protein isoform X2 n=1 Tax=Artibeus jamaicensis TaxID=9417 RepID=UPI00235B0FC8|nr:brain and acute leukemia cytoplasmic protein isoform X2 [Artibeus jamaicensis]
MEEEQGERAGGRAEGLTPPHPSAVGSDVTSLERPAFSCYCLVISFLTPQPVLVSFIRWLSPYSAWCPAQSVLEDGLPSNGAPRPTAPGGMSNPEKKTSCGTQCPNPQSLSSGTQTQKQNGFRTTETKRDTKRMPAKEVTINVTGSIQQVDRSRRITKNCVN